MSEPKRGCLTCRWADYLKTPTGRLVRGESIHCRFPMPTAADINAAVAHLLPASVPKDQYSRPHAFGMPFDGQGGSECQKWEPKT